MNRRKFLKTVSLAAGVVIPLKSDKLSPNKNKCEQIVCKGVTEDFYNEWSVGLKQENFLYFWYCKDQGLPFLKINDGSWLMEQNLNLNKINEKFGNKRYVSFNLKPVLKKRAKKLKHYSNFCFDTEEISGTILASLRGNYCAGGYWNSHLLFSETLNLDDYSFDQGIYIQKVKI